MAEPEKEIEITTSKLIMICLKYEWFQAERAYKAAAYKKKCENKYKNLKFLTGVLLV